MSACAGNEKGHRMLACAIHQQAMRQEMQSPTGSASAGLELDMS